MDKKLIKVIKWCLFCFIALLFWYPQFEITRLVLGWAERTNWGDFHFGAAFENPIYEVIYIWVLYILGMAIVGLIIFRNKTLRGLKCEDY